MIHDPFDRRMLPNLFHDLLLALLNHDVELLCCAFILPQFPFQEQGNQGKREIWKRNASKNDNGVKNLLRTDANNANISKSCKESIHRHKVRTVPNPSANTFFRSFSILLYPSPSLPSPNVTSLSCQGAVQLPAVDFPSCDTSGHTPALHGNLVQKRTWVLECSANIHRAVTKNMDGC